MVSGFVHSHLSSHPLVMLGRNLRSATLPATIRIAIEFGCKKCHDFIHYCPDFWWPVLRVVQSNNICDCHFDRRPSCAGNSKLRSKPKESALELWEQTDDSGRKRRRGSTIWN